MRQIIVNNQLINLCWQFAVLQFYITLLSNMERLFQKKVATQFTKDCEVERGVGNISQSEGLRKWAAIIKCLFISSLCLWLGVCHHTWKCIKVFVKVKFVSRCVYERWHVSECVCAFVFFNIWQYYIVIQVTGKIKPEINAMFYWMY